MFQLIEDLGAYERERSQKTVLFDNGIFKGVDYPEEWDVEPELEDAFDAEFVLSHAGELVDVSPSMFTEFAVRMPDKEKQTYSPFTFTGREYLRQIYDTDAKRSLLKCGRQVEKSTLLGNKLLDYSCIITACNSLYVAPTNMQTKVFSQDRLKEPMETSEYLRAWTTTKLSDNVFLKKFINRSQITLRYAYMNADRTRGIPADIICVDELQDILVDNIPVIEECASHSPYKIFMYSGTPKSLDNTIEYYWTNYSTQNEWAVPCHRHMYNTAQGSVKVHWNLLTEDHIGEKNLVCDKCRMPISPADPMCTWVSLNPGVLKSIPKPYEGFRIPQLMVPWISHEEILQKQLTYSRAKFYNEVLGLSYDSGTRPLTRQDVMDNCDPSYSLDNEFVDTIRKHLGAVTPIFMGVDWGTGENTYTVVSLGAYIEGRFTIFYIHRFEGKEAEPDYQMPMIEALLTRFHVTLVGVDYGGGFWPNDELTRKYGWQRIAKYQYSTPSTKVKYDDGLQRFLVHRTEVMSDLFNAIKRRDVFRFPKWDDFQNPYGADMLNIFSEYNEQMRLNQYKKSPNSTDDAFHSILLCFLASMMRYPRPDVIAPQVQTGSNSRRASPSAT